MKLSVISYWLSGGKRGFTMVELLVVVGILLVLAAIAVPMGMGAVRQAERVKCLGNLREIGVGLESYLADHNDFFPEIEMGRRSPEEEVLTLEMVLAEYLPQAEVFHCPADDEHFAATGSSYLWNSTQSGRHKLRTSFFGTENQPESVPLVLDKEAVHGGANGVNMLYADYHISNKVEFNVGPQ
jgi:prepilin-type N-terminal cleavage/methylation domain-containing protein